MKRRASTAAFAAGGLLVALLLAFLVAPRASAQPDGLNRVAIDHGLGQRGSAATSANYSVNGIHDAHLSTGVAGVLGVIVVFVAAVGVSKIVRTVRSRAVSEDAA